MAETTVTVPMGYESPAQPAQPEPRPQWAKKSIHNVRMSESILNSHQQPETPPEANAGSYDALHREIAELKQGVQLLAQNQLGGAQEQPRGPERPDPAQFDFYDPQHVEEFNRQNDQYYQQLVDARVEQKFAPHRDAIQSAEYTRQYNAAFATHGHDPNFKAIMGQALQLVAKTGGQANIEATYDLVASSQINELPTEPERDPRTGRIIKRYQERSRHLPSDLRETNSLGRIMEFHQQNGRSGRR